MMPFIETSTGSMVAAQQITSADWAFPPGVNVMNQNGWVYSVETLNGWVQVNDGDWIVMTADKSLRAIASKDFGSLFTPI